MIFNIGYLILISALVISVFGIITSVWGGQKRNTRLVEVGHNAVIGVAMLVTGAALILWYALLGDHFEVVYVWNHSEKALPTFYKFAALWGGQSGSLLFWTLLLSIYSVVVVITFRGKQQALMPYVSATLLATSLFFLMLLVFAENPFRLASFVPSDGQGLNPLLQNYWMVIHPVMLYLGYVGLVVPFAFAVGALVTKSVTPDFARAMPSLMTYSMPITGQVCFSLTRLLVPNARKQEFLDMFLSGVRGLKLGDPSDPATQMGPLAMARQRERVEGYIAARLLSDTDPSN